MLTVIKKSSYAIGLFSLLISNTFALSDSLTHVAVGEMGEQPLIVTTKNNGLSWSAFQNIDAIIPNLVKGELNSVSCADNVCNAMGTYMDKSTYETQPLFLRSIDKGETWSKVQADLPHYRGNMIQMWFLNCANNICNAVGRYNNSAILINSKDNGLSWSLIKNIANKPANFRGFADFSSLECAKNTCLITGISFNFPDDRMAAEVLLSHDNGGSWSFSQTFPALPPSYWVDVDAAVHANGNTWVISGQYLPRAEWGEKPFIYVSDDNGQTWSPKEIQYLPLKNAGVEIHHMNCQNNYCLASVDYTLYRSDSDDSFHADTLALYIVSHDNGKSWTTLKSLPALSKGFSSGPIACKNETCVISGVLKDQQNVEPVFYISHDNARTWSKQESIAGFPKDIEYFGLDSFNVQDNFWTVVGFYTKHLEDNGGGETLLDMEPLVLISQDKGNSWKFVDNIDGLVKDVRYTDLVDVASSNGGNRAALLRGFSMKSVRNKFVK